MVHREPRAFVLHCTGWHGACKCTPSLVTSSSGLQFFSSAMKSSLGVVLQKGLLLTVPQPSLLWRYPSDWATIRGIYSHICLQFEGRTEKHHFPGDSSLVTASEIRELWQMDAVAAHGYVSGYSGVTALSSSHRHEAMTRMCPKLFFSSVAVPVQTDHRNSCCQLSNSLLNPNLHFTPQ